MTHITLPKEFGDVLGNFAESYLIDRPDDIIEYAAEYFERLQLSRRPFIIYGSMESNITSFTPSSTHISSSCSTDSYTPSSLQQFIEQTEDDITIPINTPEKCRKDYSYLVNILRDIPRFSMVDEVILKDIIDMMYPVNVSAGDVVFDQDDTQDNNVYVIEQGIFNVIMINNDTCQEEILYVYANQGNFGQQFVKQGCPIPAFVRAVTDGVLWIIEGRVIYKIIAGLKKSATIINQ